MSECQQHRATDLPQAPSHPGPSQDPHTCATVSLLTSSESVSASFSSELKRIKPLSSCCLLRPAQAPRAKALFLPHLGAGGSGASAHSSRPALGTHWGVQGSTALVVVLGMEIPEQVCKYPAEYLGTI
jgi:hypothetical protein